MAKPTLLTVNDVTLKDPLEGTRGVLTASEESFLLKDA